LLFFRAGKELVGGDLAIAVANMGSKNLTAGVLSLNLLEAGFATTTRAAVTDVFAEEPLGWHTGAHSIFVALSNRTHLLVCEDRLGTNVN
jgi:hypothetical protein